MTRNIAEGNSLIAEFFGWPAKNVAGTINIHRIPNRFPFTDDINDDYGWTEWDAEHIGFDDNWNYLMAAIDKIESLNRISIEIDKYGCNVRTIDFFEGCSWGFYGTEDMTKIQAVWLAVVEWIEWFNKQNKTSQSKVSANG